MSSKSKQRKVHGARRIGAEYNWFYLIVDGLRTIEVADKNVTWNVDPDATDTKAMIKRDATQKDPATFLLKVKSVTITGPQHEIDYLLTNIMLGTPRKMLC